MIPSYLRRMFGAGLVVGGGYFLVEHIYHFGFEWWDIIGHEWLGLGMIVGGVLVTMRWKRTDEPADHPQ
jgi:hypothetical protein